MDASGNDLLHYAVLKDNPSMAEVLLAHGVKVNTPDSDGRGLLFQTNNPLMIGILLKNGAQIEAVDKQNRSVLIDAIENGDYSKIMILLDSGANIKTASKYFSCLFTTKMIRRLLIKNGSNFTIRESESSVGCPYKVQIGWTILGIGNLHVTFNDPEINIIHSDIGTRPNPTIALRTGLNLWIALPHYPLKLYNEVFFVYRGEESYDITDFVYSPMLRFYFTSGGYYLGGGLEYSHNLSFKVTKNSQSDKTLKSGDFYGFQPESNTIPKGDFGVNKSTWSTCLGIGLEIRRMLVELRYKKDLSEYYTHYHKKQSSFYLLFGIKLFNYSIALQLFNYQLCNTK